MQQHECVDIDGEVLCAFTFYCFTLLTLAAAGFWAGLSMWKTLETGGKNMLIPGVLGAGGILLLRVSSGVFGLNKRAKGFAYGVVLTSLVIGEALSPLPQWHAGFVLSFFLWDVPLAGGVFALRLAQKKRTTKRSAFYFAPARLQYKTICGISMLSYCFSSCRYRRARQCLSTRLRGWARKRIGEMNG